MKSNFANVGFTRRIPSLQAVRGPLVALATAGLVAAGLAAASPASASTELTVSPTTATRVAPNTTAYLDGLALSGAADADSLQVTLATTAGTLAVTPDEGVAKSYGNDWSGTASITFTGNQADINATLATAELSAGDNAGKTATISLAASPADDSHVYLAQNQHYYEYVSAPGISWTDADAAAKARPLFQGQRGYLATIPNSTVNSFIQSRIEGAVNVWFGARAYNDGKDGFPRSWRWAEGPGESPLRGQVLQYCDSSAYSRLCSAGAANNGRYNSWASGEPNNFGQCDDYDDFDGYCYHYSGGEDFPVTNYTGPYGRWNDFPNSIGSSSSGYVVEYGDQVTGSSGFDQTVTAKSDVLIAAAPEAPTGVVATPGNGSASVSFTAPATNGSPITGYTVTSSPGGKTATCPGSPCVVDGLVNGSSYTFTVVATNAYGDSASSQSSGTVMPYTVPGAPTDVVATHGDSSASVEFDAPADNGGSPITSYTVTSSPDGNTGICPGSPCVVNGLSNGTSYGFSVVAANEAGNGPAGSTTSAVTPATVPGAPSIDSVVRGNGKATVTFTAPDGDGGSTILDYRISAGSVSVTCTESPCDLTGLDNGHTYSVTVEARNNEGYGATSDAKDVTPATVPDAVTDLEVTRADGSAELTFDAPVGDGGEAITGYESSIDGGTSWQTLPTTGTDTLSATIDGLTNGATYAIRVRAVNGVGGSAAAGPKTVTPATVPGTPTSVTATRGATSGSVTVTWTAPDNGGNTVTGYTVTTSPDAVDATTCTSSPCTVSGLDNGTSYTFTVHATNSVGDGAESAASNAAVPATTAGAPTSLSVTSGAGTLSLSFKAPENSGGADIAGYEYSVDGSTWHALTTNGRGPITATISGLTNGTTYPVRVRATNAVGGGSASDTVSATPATTPGAPGSPKATVANGDVTVTWTAPTDNGGSPITGYEVTAQPGGATCSTDGATRCTFTDLATGRTYRFTVRATNANGSSTATGTGAGTSSARSGAVSVTGVPSSPRGLRVVTGDRVLTVTYRVPADNGGAEVVGYRVSTDGGRTWKTVRSTSTSFRGVLNGKSYRVVVRAINARGDSAPTATTATTRQWFRDPVSAAKRKTERAVPAKPSSYHGRPVATRATARSHNGTPAVPATSLHGRQLQKGQATSLNTDGLFGFDSATLNAAGKRQVRTIVRSLTYVDSAVCEGYADFGGNSAHQKMLSQQRATAFCKALQRGGAKVRMTSKGYGASRPAIIGGTSKDRAANRRVILLITG